MHSFLFKLLAFILPVVAIFILPFFVFINSGEFTPLSEVVARQNKDPNILYRLAYDNNAFAYKLATAKARNPEILALGTSRGMQFRSGFFKNPAAF